LLSQEFALFILQTHDSTEQFQNSTPILSLLKQDVEYVWTLMRGS